MIHNIKGLTEVVREMVCREECAEPWENICLQEKEDGKQEPNIEDILSRVRGLRDYAGAGDVRGLNKTILDKLEKKICDAIVECVSKVLPNKSTPYHHLTAWIGAIDRSESVQIFTTNYDLLIEQALEDLRIPFFDGFVGSRQPFFDPHGSNLIRYPHGGLDCGRYIVLLTGGAKLLMGLLGYGVRM